MTSIETAPAAALGRVRAWGERRDWRGNDPYDALNAPLAPVLTLGTALGRRLLTQLVKRSAIDLRRPLGIRPDWNAKAIGLVASAYAHLAAAGDDGAGAQAGRWLDWLADASTADRDLAWGYHFDVQTRFFRYRRGTPNVIATGFVAHAYLDAVELLGDEQARVRAAGACRFLVARLLVEADRPYFAYLEGERELVHNANALACSVLARASRLGVAGASPDVARAALASTLDAQADDGSWPYSVVVGRWVDNFHTAYVLESLARALELEPDRIRPALERGLAYWRRHLFEADGTPRSYAHASFPIESKNYAQAIDTWVTCRGIRPDALAEAGGLAAALATTMIAEDGSVVFQRHRHLTHRVPFVRWTAAPAFHALSRLLHATSPGASG